MKILIYGSAYVTELTTRLLMEQYEVVGHVPCVKPNFPGRMPVPEVSPDTPHDLLLSVMYDRKVTDLRNAFNVHPGLLPEYAGCDILYHTIKDRISQQGVTFHSMTDELDSGRIISKAIYPVHWGEGIVDLYKKVSAITPGFVLSCVRLLPFIELQKIPITRPTRFFKRGQVKDKELYERGRLDIEEFIAERNRRELQP